MRLKFDMVVKWSGLRDNVYACFINRNSLYDSNLLSDWKRGVQVTKTKAWEKYSIVIILKLGKKTSV